MSPAPRTSRFDGPWPAPGKLNLCLHVVGRRPDGYHLLQTAFQFIDLCDQIRFHERPPGVIERLRQIPGVAPESDLTVRAARIVRSESGATPGIWRRRSITPGGRSWKRIWSHKSMN